ncbi:hypothetical protein AGMMS50218_14450 [Actinomycetota bacterium]|nr:hypothetical protein AGMMS50218_14450 [Actinomycetota bacterium]
MRDARRAGRQVGDGATPGRGAEGQAAPGTERRPLSPGRRQRLRRRRRSLLAGGAAVLVLCLVGGGVALAVGRSDGVRYRTAIASTGSVEQTVDATGTLSSATRFDRGFAVAGTVAAVDVGVGDTVSAGQVLASLDPTDLQDAVDAADSTLADARQRLQDDIDSQTTTSTATSSTGTSSTGTAATGASSGGATTGASTTGAAAAGTEGVTTADPGSAAPTGTATAAAPSQAAIDAAVAAVTAAQTALLTQYGTATAALDASSTAVTSSQAACTAFLALIGDSTDDDGGTSGGTGDGTRGATADPSADPTAEADPTADATPDPTADATAETASFTTSLVTGTTATADGTTTAADLVACQDAIQGVLTAQTTVGDAQTALMTLATALDEAVATAQQLLAAAAQDSSDGSGGASGGGTGGTTGDSTGSGSGSGSGSAGADGTSSGGSGASGSTGSAGSTASGGTGGSGGSGTTGTGSAANSTVATAADLLADQAAIDLAEADLALAQSRLGFVDLTSPVAGTVAAVSIAAGDTVTAASTSAVITVIGTDGFVVQATVPLSDVEVLDVGQAAAITAGSTDAALTGVVSSIGILDASSTSEPSYTVLVAVDATDAPLYDGGSAQVVITVAGSGDALTVPSSAVHVDGSSVTVQVLRDGAVSDVEVVCGAVGPELTEITSGLTEGDEVVLADLTQALVGDDSTTESGLTGLSGSTDETQFGTGQLPAGGFGGGQMMGGPPGS